MATPDGGVRVEGLRDLTRSLEAMGVDVVDIKNAFGSIAAKAASLASSFAPRKSGALQASIKGNRAKNAAIVKAGSARVPYAGAINYGWPRRNIPAAGFMQKADDQMRPHVAHDLEVAIERLIAQKGLS